VKSDDSFLPSLALYGVFDKSMVAFIGGGTPSFEMNFSVENWDTGGLLSSFVAKIWRALSSLRRY